MVVDGSFWEKNEMPGGWKVGKEDKSREKEMDGG